MGAEEMPETNSNDSSLRRSITLLDLPMDILKVIVNEIPNTSDLTSLSRTCSVMHSLAIANMYSRFDIVWPEETSTTEQPGVDALSYGLATLVMGEELFGPMPAYRFSSSRTCCPNCGCDDTSHQKSSYGSRKPQNLTRFRRGNNYAKYTRHFSVGNGPEAWVLEYTITKDTGKMLGTLVALAVARMINLESFTWDMPTGVLRDVWIALSSLADRPGCDCRLETVWVRWHDNTAERTPSPNSPDNFLADQSNLSPYLALQRRYGHVEYPTFSILPPLRSLSVLDIDEAAYLDEMEVLIQRSHHKLRELRIGISAKTCKLHWVEPREDTTDKPLPENESRVPGWPRTGGVLSIILSKTAQEAHMRSTEFDQTATAAQALDHLTLEDENSSAGTDQLGEGQHRTSYHSTSSQAGSITLKYDQKTQRDGPDTSTSEVTKLNLEVLELERVTISTPVISSALNWCCLTSLTILRCQGHEKLWRLLRREFSPEGADERSKNPRAKAKAVPDQTDIPATRYLMRLKRLHTDTVSPYLMLFLKETIAPNSLEQFLIQEAPDYQSVVPAEAIYRHVIRRQRGSLRKVLVDAAQRHDDDYTALDTQWRKWMFNREMLSFVTSGRMPQLLELGMAIDRHDWHFLLRRLPYVPNLRALYIPNYRGNGYLTTSGNLELALHMLDIVTLRPEMELCYLALGSKCYELYEVLASQKKQGRFFNLGSSLDPGVAGSHEESDGYEQDDDNDDDADDDEEEQDQDEADDDGNSAGEDDNHQLEFEGSHSVADDDYSEEDDMNGVGYNEPRSRLQIREIMFYDDKVTIFKARHGKL